MKNNNLIVLFILVIIILSLFIGYIKIKDNYNTTETESPNVKEDADKNIDSNLPPTANAGDDQSVLINNTVYFRGTGTDQDGFIVLYEWDFEGDGIFNWSNAVTGFTSYIYNASGIYAAVLRITDNNGAKITDNCIITVKNHMGSNNFSSVRITDHNSYTKSGIFTIVGMVKNIGLVNLAHILINGTIYNKDDNVIKQTSTFAMLSILTPNQESPFKLEFTEHPEYDYYILNVSYEETENQPYTQLHLQGVTNDTGILGEYYLTGDVQNNGSVTVDLIEVVATIYNSNNKVIETSLTSVDPKILLSGKSGVFEFTIDTNPLPGTIHHYFLQVQGNEA